MMQRFETLGRKRRNRRTLPDGVSAADLAIGQVLALAKSADFQFDVIDGQLVIVSPRSDWQLWPAVKACLDDIGVEAIVEYFARTTPARRETLSAPA